MTTPSMPPPSHPSNARDAARTVPDGLRERVLQASLAERVPGRYAPEVPPIPPIEAFTRAAAALDTLLGELTDDEWHLPVLRDLDVQGLVGHLIGVEDDVRRGLAADPTVALADHVAATQPTALQQHGLLPTVTHDRWREAVSATKRAFAPPRPGEVAISVHGIRVPSEDLLVIRTFELWAHENDIRRATGRPATAPDSSSLSMMTALAGAALPTGAARIGLTTPIALRLVLTGAGGGTWNLRLGPEPTEIESSGPAVVAIVTDAVGFCRLVSRRISPSDLDLAATGEESVVGTILAAAAALALD